MECWKKVWRLGLAPVLSTAGLQALHRALVDNDGRLLQGATTNPPALEVLADEEVAGACALGFCFWQGDGRRSVGAVTADFSRLCQTADEVLGEPAACRRFLDWFDATPRSAMRRQLLPEVEGILAQRRQAAA